MYSEVEFVRLPNDDAKSISDDIKGRTSSAGEFFETFSYNFCSYFILLNDVTRSVLFCAQ